MTIGLLSVAGLPMRFASANIAGPTSSGGLSVQTGTSMKTAYRIYFSIGSGDRSRLRLSFFAWFISAGVGVSPLGNGYTINLVSMECNGTSAPVTFSAARNKTILNGDTDIQTDDIFPATFGLSKFAQGMQGYIRLEITFSAPTTDFTIGNGSEAQSGLCYDYDPNKASLTNGIDSTGPITYSMINSGVDGVNIKRQAFPMSPAVLGTFITNDAPTWVIAGDSTAFGTGGNVSAEGSRGISYAMYPNPASPTSTGAIANWNLGCNAGAAVDWANGTPSFLNAYLKYFKYGIDEYGTNSLNITASQVIHATMRANGIKGIIRTSLTPRTNSTDNWVTDANQSQQASWGPGSAADTFETSLQALVASDLVYMDYHTPSASLSNYWLWLTNGTAFFETADGLHPSTNGYINGKALGTGTVKKVSGTTSTTLQALIASYL